MNANKSIPLAALELVMRRNKEASDNLFQEAKRLMDENKVLGTELKKLSSAPPPEKPSEPPQDTEPMFPEDNLLFCANKLVRSWTRRRKKTYTVAERDLLKAVRAVANRGVVS